jgi:hypothetical protein
VLALLLTLPTSFASLSREAPGAIKWPRLMMFYGGALGSERRYMTNHEDVIAFVDSLTLTQLPLITPAPSQPFVEVALYWGNPYWEQFATDSARLKNLPLPGALRPAGPQSFVIPGVVGQVEVERGRQDARIWTARLYLATSEKAALFDFAVNRLPGARPLAAASLDLLRKIGVPTSVK